MRVLFLCILFASLARSAHGQSTCAPIFAWYLDEADGNVSGEAVSGKDFLVHNNYNKPEWVNGVKGNALRLDGFSTWVAGDITMPGLRSFSISVWYATEAYPTANAAIINQKENNKGFSLELDKFGFLNFIIHADGTTQRVALNTPLPKYQWNLITAIADLEQQTLRLLLNGNMTNEILLPLLDSFDWSLTTLKIAQHNQTALFANLWPTGVLNGVIDEVAVFPCALTDDVIENEYATNMPGPPVDLSIPVSRHMSDKDRPRFHAMPPTSWTNEPYGLIYHNNYYHLFYQKNPNGPYHSHMHWGHLRSEDLVEWEDQPIALAPEPGWGQHGIWSGHVIKDGNGAVYAFYTGVDGVKAGVGIAYPDEQLKLWRKDDLNPLIANPPPTYNHMDFRDPFVWQHDGKWHMIVGSGIHHVGGILMTYTSNDLRQWEVATPLFYDNFERSGRFWEMPAFFQLGEKWILLVNTVPWEGVPAETIYWVGEWSGGRFQPDHEFPKKFDIINGPLLAPSISEDSEGRMTAIGIIPETRSPEWQNRSGWTHIYSLPRVLRLLEDGNLGQIPHPNLCRLRQQEIETISDLEIIEKMYGNLPNTIGDNLEISMRVVVDADEFALTVRKSADGSEFTTLVFDEVNNRIVVDRTHSSQSAGVARDVREGDYVFARGDTLDVRLFVDRSVVEVFVDEVAALATRIYPAAASSLQYDISPQGGSIRLIDMHAWVLDTATMSTAVCEPEKLRVRFRSEVIAGISDELGAKSLRAFPNPAAKTLALSCATFIECISFTDINGREVISPLDVRGFDVTVSVNELRNGLYILRVKTNNGIIYKRVIIQD